MTANDLILSALRSQVTPWPIATDEFATLTLEEAQDHGVAALLAMTPGVRSWPECVRAPLMQGLRVEAAAEAIRQRGLQQLLETLDKFGITALLLKGAQLAYTHYPRPWLRPRLDTDLIVAPTERFRTGEVLGMLGYRPTTHFGGELVTHQFQYERLNRYGVMDYVDLHWKVANPHVFAGAFSFEELESRAVCIGSLGPNARGLSNADALILACVHRVAHHHNSLRLIWLYDIHLLISAMGLEGWEAFVNLALAKRLGSVCADGLVQAQVCFGTEVPHQWLGCLQAARLANEPTAGFLRTGRTKLNVLGSDLQALRGWRSKVQIIREHLFPPVAYIRRAYGVSNPAMLPLAYGYRIARGVGRWSRRQ